MKKVIFWNFSVTIILILILEIFIRIFDIVTLQGNTKDIFFSKNDIILSKSNKNFKVFGIKSKTDKYGFRIPLNNFQYNEQKPYTLILGDSVSFGVGVKEEDSFIGIMRKKTNNNLLNTSIMGHNLKSHLHLLKENYKNFNTNIDQIVIFLCLNDVVPFQGVVKKEDINNENNFFENFVKNKFTLNLNIFLREHSALFVLLKGIFTNPVKRHYDYMLALYEEEDNLKEFENYIRKIYLFSESNNLKTKFILLPYAHQIKKNCEKDLMVPQKIINKIFTKQGLKLYDYSSNFCSEKDSSLFLKFDPVHLSKYGHKYVSNLIIEDKIFY